MPVLGQQNPNVILYLIAQFFFMAGWSVWGFSLLSNIIYLITSSTLEIGFSEGIQGVCSGLLAIPFGFLADKWMRHKVAKIGLIIKTVSCVCLICVINIKSTP